MASEDGKNPLPGKGKGKKDGSRALGGPSGECVCPSCGRSFSHRRGVPCAMMVCPRCGSPMMRK